MNILMYIYKYEYAYATLYAYIYTHKYVNKYKFALKMYGNQIVHTFKSEYSVRVRAIYLIIK